MSINIIDAAEETYHVTCEKCGTVWNQFEFAPARGLCKDCAPSRLVRTAAQFARECEQEAVRKGYRLVFRYERDILTAGFFNAEFHCYDKEWPA